MCFKRSPRKAPKNSINFGEWSGAERNGIPQNFGPPKKVSTSKRKEVKTMQGTEKKQVKITMNAEIAEKFKAICKAREKSMAEVVTEYITKYSGAMVNSKRTIETSKRARRGAIKKVIQKIGNVLESEERYMERIPENLHGSGVYERSEEWINILEEAIELLSTLP